MSFTEIFGGTVIWPSNVSYLPLDLDANTTLEWPLEAATGSNLVARIIDITPTGEYTITMPPADETGEGQTILFNNLGPDDVDIVDNDGGALLTLSQGEVWQIYLTDNSDAAGTWRVFQYGASTAQAQAAALAGPGIVAIGSTLGQAMTMSTINTTPYTLASGDRAQGFVWIGAVGTVNLPAAATAGGNWFVNIRNGGTGALTIDPSGAETINDEATLVMNPGDSAVIATDGSEWWTIGLGKQAIFAFDYTTIDLAGESGDYVLAGAELNRIAYEFTGALAGNTVIRVPNTVQQYWVLNSATGFTLSLQTVDGSTPVSIASGDKSIYYSNGAEVVLAVTTSGIATPISIADGGTNATSAANARSNLGAAATGNNTDITALQGLTAAVVAVTFAGDTNTGYGTSGADALAGNVGGSLAYKITNTAGGNLSFGALSLDSITSGVGNTAMGYEAGTAATTADNCTLVGREAAELLTTGDNNTAIGYLALGKVTTGGQNTALGSGAGFEITGNQNTCLGTNVASASALTGDNNTLVGYNASPSGSGVSNEFTLGNSSVSNLRCNDTSISALSDERDKTNIEPIPLGLKTIREMRPVMFDWARRDGSLKGAKDFGFIAQELDKLKTIKGYRKHLRLVHKNNPDRWEADPMKTYPVLIRAVQQLADICDEQAKKIKELEARIG